MVAVEALQLHPLIGRSVESACRELVISRGKSGYVALYRYDEVRDAVLVLAIRHQREAGCI
jgi:plasmid stabilization system protein ParE